MSEKENDEGEKYQNMKLLFCSVSFYLGVRRIGDIAVEIVILTTSRITGVSVYLALRGLQRWGAAISSVFGVDGCRPMAP